MTEQPNSIAAFEAEVRVANSMPATNLLLPELLEISRSMPDNVNGLDGGEAAELANKFLKGIDICAELLPLAISYELRTSATMKQEYSKATLVRASEAGYKSAVDRKEYANGDEVYLQAHKKHIEATMFRTLIEEKKQVFSKAHHLMKNIFAKDAENSGEVVNSTGGSDRRNWSQRSSWASND